jgi:hypothetical protein
MFPEIIYQAATAAQRDSEALKNIVLPTAALC